MIDRYFAFFDIKTLLLVLSIAYVLLLTSNNISGFIEVFTSMFFVT